MIGADYDSIQVAEDRQAFGNLLAEIGIDTPKNGIAHNMAEAEALQKEIGFPCIIRPSFTLGGTGASMIYNVEEFNSQVAKGLEAAQLGL